MESSIVLLIASTMLIGNSFGVVQAIFNLIDRQNEVLPRGNKWSSQFSKWS